jgi:hypothetical protein
MFRGWRCLDLAWPGCWDVRLEPGRRTEAARTAIVPQKRINREDEPRGGRHDREDVFPGEGNSSYTHTNSSR